MDPSERKGGLVWILRAIRFQQVRRDRRTLLEPGRHQQRSQEELKVYLGSMRKVEWLQPGLPPVTAHWEEHSEKVTQTHGKMVPAMCERKKKV
jgi:hypothetical protein